VKTTAFFLFMLFLANIFLNVGCADMQRSPQSGYFNYDGVGPHEVSLHDLAPATNVSQPVSSQENEAYRQQMFRKNLESNLKTSEERSQYLRFKPYMSEADRIEFLQLNDIYSRERFAMSKGFASNPEKYSRGLASLIEQNDIALGMNKESVRDSWGDPDFVDVSGNPKLENERWRFSVPVETPEGYQIEERFVFFENGRVAGWTSR